MKALILKFVVPTLILTAIVLLEGCGKPKAGDNTDGKTTYTFSIPSMLEWKSSFTFRERLELTIEFSSRRTQVKFATIRIPLKIEPIKRN